MTAPLPRPGPLAAAVGVLRIAAVVAFLVAATPVLLLSLLVPIRVGGVRLILRVGQGICRGFLALCGVTREVTGGERLRAHRGMVFFNHPSFIDPMVVMSASPVRFLGAAGVRKIPFVGPMARAAGTLFVNRGDTESRAEARDALRAALRGVTPVALAPEGGIWKDAGVGPLRHGAFEVAAEAEAPVLLAALAYTDRAHLRWDAGEWLLGPLWRLCARTTPFAARLTVAGEALHPTPGSVEALAETARRRLERTLGDTAAAEPTLVAA